MKLAAAPDADPRAAADARFALARALTDDPARARELANEVIQAYGTLPARRHQLPAARKFLHTLPPG